MAERIRDRIEQARGRMAEAAVRVGRDPDEVELIAVTKTVQVPRIREAIEAGATVLGENRIQEAADKIALLSAFPIRWHLIGHLQTNKSRAAAELFEVIHSLDSIKLAAALDRHGAALQKRIRVLVEVNLEGEPSKSGILEHDLVPLLDACRQFSNLVIDGLMAIPPFRKHPEDVRPFFRRLRLLRDEAAKLYPNYPLRHLSMGMSHDFEVAIEEGATLVRIGTAIFEARPEG
ncbi:MAG: YggS family pyridoxal phosphate-dependent enzyme [Candidatus Methylomirabilota bacterium]|nr:YggS family pyridoxal phosphate-dependent enzyme [Candidatus Methylomirabilis sp.]PWB42459.1 MAG: YggS family pyridoxal phosphate-dependent enzyme [candidate division NC10 bacterium]